MRELIVDIYMRYFNYKIGWSLLFICLFYNFFGSARVSNVHLRNCPHVCVLVFCLLLFNLVIGKVIYF